MGATAHINREAATALRLVNTTGAALVAGEFTVMRGRGLVALEAIASLAEGALQDANGCELQVNEFDTGEDTFAAADLSVYFDTTAKKFSHVASVGHWKVGKSNAAKDAAGVLDVIGCVPVEVVDGVAELAAAIADHVADTVDAHDASAISVANASSIFAGDQVEEILDELGVDATTAQATIVVPLGAITQEDGTALTKQASTVAGFAQLADKEVVIDIPVNCTAGESLQFTTPVPQDLDDTEDITVHVLAGKAANLDVLTLDCEVYPCAVGDTANADIQDTAAQTITEAASELVFTCGADGVLEAPGTLTVVLALGGTNDGDAVYIYGAWIEYTRKILAA